MFENLRKTLQLLTIHEQRRLVPTLIIIILAGIFEVIGVTSILPFISILATPAQFVENHYVQKVMTLLNIQNTQDMIFYTGIFALCAIVLNNLINMLSVIQISKISNYQTHRLSVRMISHYIHMPFIRFLNMNSNDIMRNCLDESHKAINGCLQSWLRLFSKMVSISLILLLLLAAAPELVLLCLACLGGLYVLIYLMTHKKLKNIGLIRQDMSRWRLREVNTILRGFREIRVLGKDAPFVEKYEKSSAKSAKHSHHYQIISEFPRYIVETVTFGGILAILIYYLSTGVDFYSSIPTLTLFTFAGYRLLPAVNALFTAIANIKVNRVSVDLIHAEQQKTTLNLQDKNVKKLPFTKTIGFKKVCFNYETRKDKVLQDVNLTIKPNKLYAVIGQTGAGKSTLMDLFLGLLQPSEGEIQVDGLVLNDQNIKRWQANIGYVPQEIFLYDDTVAANIALGVDADKVDKKKLHKAAQAAQIHDFIMKDMQAGYETLVGDRGIHLSGGQRQRIAIARALYHDPSLLVFDEATSGLDNQTENKVLDIITGLVKNKTVIMITHRLHTLKKCDEIIMLDQGQLHAVGSYDKLIKQNKLFKTLIAHEFSD